MQRLYTWRKCVCTCVCVYIKLRYQFKFVEKGFSNLQICVHSCTAFGIEDDLKPTSQHKRDDRPFSLADLRPSTLQPRRGSCLELRGSATNEVRLLQVASEHGGCWRYFYRALHTESFVGVISCVVRTIRCRHRCLTQICSVCVNCSNLDG